jgi:hypothetical protein
MLVDDLWYKNAIIYCLDVEKFMDANGDGTGDFEGLSRQARRVYGGDNYPRSLGVLSAALSLGIRVTNIFADRCSQIERISNLPSQRWQAMESASGIYRLTYRMANLAVWRGCVVVRLCGSCLRGQLC